MTKSDWIAVEDRLPVNFESVLLVNHDEGDYVLQGYCHDGDWYSDYGVSELIGVSHWMPLPELPTK
jgi:hypothetical protein